MNSFSSADPVKPLDLSKLAIAPEWVITPMPPAATPGAHRFVWDLHYAPPAAFKDWNGSWAAPGRYTVEVDVDGQALRQPLLIAPDPRISVSQADFDAQLALARQIEQSRVLAHSLLKDADAIKDEAQRRERSGADCRDRRHRRDPTANPRKQRGEHASRRLRSSRHARQRGGERRWRTQSRCS